MATHSSCGLSGPTGEVLRFYENAVYFPEILGSELVPDSQLRPTPFPEMTYAAASYGGENEFGFSFAAHLKIWLFGTEAGRGTAYASGVRDGNRLDGTFAYTTELTLAEGPPFVAGLSYEYEFYGLRE